MLGKTNVKVKPNERDTIDYVEYITSSGTQYIDTGVIAKDYKKIKYEVDMTMPTSYPQAMWGAQSFLASSAYLMKKMGSSSLTIVVGENETDGIVPSSITRVTGTVEANAGVLPNTWEVNYLADGVVTTKKGTFSGSFATTSITIFANNTTSGVTDKAKVSLYSFKIFGDDTLIRDFKPCKDESGVYCLYDKVSKTYFYNKGTGNFTGGDSI